MNVRRHISLDRQGEFWTGRFPAMASDCEIQLFTQDRAVAEHLTFLAAHEAWRIQDKFSRYQSESIVSKINNAKGEAIKVDDETAALIDFAIHCFHLSEGLFDISSGILRRVWHFDCSDRLPSPDSVQLLLPLIGLDKIEWYDRWVQMPSGMELDFGGIGKEYAVDKVLLLLSQTNNIPILVNFGGDITINRPPTDHRHWAVGISSVTDDKLPQKIIKIASGGIATSGDAQRYLLKDGIRYSHILNPMTGYPTQNAPRSVTVIASTCTDAGILATLAMLKGKGAEAFLREQNLDFFCYR